jgi:hypothetical protein
VPDIGEWQLIRRCEPAPDEEHRPRADDPVLTDMGVPLPSAPPGVAEVEADAHDPEQVFDIDRVLSAKKVGGKYILMIKWKGYADPTPMPRAQLLRECNNDELRREIDEAVQRYQEETRLPPEDEDDPEHDEDTEVVNPAVGPTLMSQHGRPVRHRNQTVRYTPGAANVVIEGLQTLHTIQEGEQPVEDGE